MASNPQKDTAQMFSLAAFVSDVGIQLTAVDVDSGSVTTVLDIAPRHL